jgi:hypothetical protein
MKKPKKRKEERGSQSSPFVEGWWRPNLPDIHWLWQAQLCQEEHKKKKKKKQEKKQKRGSQSSLIVANGGKRSSLAHMCSKPPQKKTKEEEEWVHVYLGVVNETPATLDARAQASSFSGLLLLKLMLQAVQASSFPSSPSFKLSKLTLNHEPKC